MAAEALLTDLFKQLASISVQLAKQEIKLLVGVDEKVQKLQDKLGFIKAMMDDADKRHAKKLDTERLWLEQLQDKYYEMDDVLDTWNTARIKAEIEKEEGKPADINAPAVVKKKVCSFFPSPSCCFNLPLRHDLGHKIKKLNEKLDEIFNDREKYGIDFKRQPEVVERPRTTSFVDESGIIGRDRNGDELRCVLLGKGSPKERKPHVISLVGMGGLGKTTLAQIAYNHGEVQAHFDKRMWVCVSDPFDQCKVAKAIIESFESPPNTTELQSLLDKLCSLIGGKRFFLVLDDVWTEDSTKWEPFRNALKYGVEGSRILVTTRTTRVANMMESSSIINLGVLSTNDCWLIIKKIAFSNDYGEQYRDLEELGKQLANKCKGLPLAAKILGSYLRGKMGKNEWEKVLNNDLWKLEDIENGLLGPFFLSYYELSPSEKQCFLFCAIFPKDYQFNKFELITNWMAQGYVNSKFLLMEDIAEEYFEKLAMRSFFQDFEKDKNDRIKSCKMHDIVHDFAQSLTKDVCFTIKGEEEVKIDFKRARQLSLTVKETFPESVYEARNLRTLFLHSCKSDVHQSHERGYVFNMHLSNSCHHFICLRTLILHGPFTKLPDAVENLIHLRCLHMYKNVLIEELPETLCNLCNLQTLNIDKGDYFKKLPQGMGKLINLRQLRFKRDYFSKYFNVKFPNGIEKLTCLRTLSDFNIGDNNDREGCKLGELRNLNQLRGSFKMYGLGNVVDVGEAQNAQLKNKIHLHDLELDFYVEDQFREKDQERRRRRMESDVAVLNALEPPSHLEKLSIKKVMATTVYTNWMTSLTNLKSLDINWCYLLECLPPLGKLPLLKELNIMGADNVKKLGDEFLGIESENKSKKDDCHIINIFPNLRVLNFFSLESWKEWIGMGGKRLEVEEEKDSGLVSDPIIKIMPRLESLTIQSCRELKCLPDYLRTTPLQELIIESCPILKRRCKREIGGYWPIISHIPTIKIDDDYVQRNGQPQFDSNNQSEDEEDGFEYESDELVEEDIDEEDGSEYESDEQVEEDIDEGDS